MGLRPAALALLGLAAAAASALPLPLPDAGPHLNYGWGEPIRLRHLYTASKHGLFSCFLRIGADGRVDAASSQSPQSLLEIRAVAVRTVAIKGVQSSRYLCMDEAGRLHGQVSTALLDFSFGEELQPAGCQAYNSCCCMGHGAAIPQEAANRRGILRGKGCFPTASLLPCCNSTP
ncbi:FGF19 factor, partial [Acrocephalus arundinaceus]|nr:FGF19 factor [Acrocephalus arundinaceus]